jgi:hypothetical protein
MRVILIPPPKFNRRGISMLRGRAVGVLMLVILAFACVVAVILWPPRCSTSPGASIGYSILLAGCDRR